MRREIIILTGEKQSGKTSFLMQWCSARNDVGGILTPIYDGKREFYDIGSGSRFKMETDQKENVYSVGRYRFLIEGFNKADNIIRAPHTNTRYLVLDEIGPLELLSKKGFYQTLLYLLENPGNPALVLVCRAGLALDLKDLCAQYGNTSSIQTAAINSLPPSI